MKKFSMEKHDYMAMAQCQQLYTLQKEARLRKGSKTPERNRALEAKVAMLQTKTENSSNESFFADEKLKDNKRNNAALDNK